MAAGDYDTSTTNIEDIIAAFQSGPLASILTEVIKNAFSGAMMNQVTFGPGSTSSFGFSNLFGQQDTSMQYISFMREQMLSMQLSPAQQQLNDMRMQAAARTQRFFGAGENAEALAGDRFNATNILSNYLFNQMQPDQLMSGLQQATQFLGGGTPLYMLAGNRELYNSQVDTNDRIQSMNSAIVRDFTSNPTQYGGLMGRGVGQVVAELGRTGALSRFTNGDNFASEDERIAELENTVREASRVVASFRRIFRGGVREVIDQMNNMMGVDVIGTLGGAGADLANRMTGTGIATGFDPGQMQMLSRGVGQVISANGIDPITAAVGGINAATILTSARWNTPEGGNAFVNHNRFRNTVIQRVAGAQESGIARSMAGAYAIMMDRGMTAEAAQSALRGLQGTEITGSDIVGVLESAGINGVSISDIRSAGYSQTADRFRMTSPMTGMMALQSNLNVVQDEWSMIAEELGVDQDIIDTATGMRGGFTYDNLVAAAGNRLDSSMLGMLRNRFTASAKSRNLGNMEEAQKLMRAAQMQKSLDNIRAQGDMGARIADSFQGKGIMGGLLAFRSLIDENSDLGDTSLRSLFGQIFKGGEKGSDISQEEAMQLQGQMRGLSEAFADDVEASLGIGAAMTMLKTGMINGRAATSDELKEARDLLTTTKAGDAGARDRLVDFSKKAGGDERFEFEKAQIVAEMRKKESFGVSFMKADVGSEENRQSRAANIATLRRAREAGKISEDDMEDVKTYEKLMMEDSDITLADIKETYGLGSDTEAEKMRTKLRSIMSAQAGGSSGGIISVLLEIKEAILGLDGKTKRKGDGG